MKKRLYRSHENRAVSGVLGGLGDYLDLDPVLVRLIYIMLTVFTGFIPGIVGYVAAIVIIPQESTIISSAPVSDESGTV